MPHSNGITCQRHHMHGVQGWSYLSWPAARLLLRTKMRSWATCVCSRSELNRMLSGYGHDGCLILLADLGSTGESSSNLYLRWARRSILILLGSRQKPRSILCSLRLYLPSNRSKACLSDWDSLQMSTLLAKYCFRKPVTSTSHCALVSTMLDCNGSEIVTGFAD